MREASDQKRLEELSATLAPEYILAEFDMQPHAWGGIVVGRRTGGFDRQLKRIKGRRRKGGGGMA